MRNRVITYIHLLQLSFKYFVLKYIGMEEVSLIHGKLGDWRVSSSNMCSLYRVKIILQGT